jgi:crossover junction endodeoxyribonuclease RuvC
MIISIDPGLTGAIAYFTNEGLLNYIEDMPITAKINGKGNQVNANLLSELFVDVDRAIIERVHAMPGQGVTSVFSFGRSLGVIEGILAANQIPIEWITPQKWKKHFSLLGKPKDASRTLAIELYPNHLDLFKRKKDNGRSDAVLIGLSCIGNGI